MDAQIPLMSEHLTNLQLMRLNLQAKATIPEAERLQLEQEQKELRLKELELDQRSFELFSQYPFRSGAHSKTRTPHYMVKRWQEQTTQWNLRKLQSEKNGLSVR